MAQEHRQGFYDACDGKGWQACDEGLSVEDSLVRDAIAWRAEVDRAEAMQPKFHVGQVISTEEEYAALPPLATVWTDNPNPKYFWTRVSGGMVSPVAGGQPVEISVLAGAPRTIRSLPSEAT